MLPAIDAILKQDHGLKLVYKIIPVLGAGSVLESRAILAAQLQGAALPMQAALMTNPAQPTDALIHDTAVKLGLSPEKLARDMTGKLVTQRINANLDLAKAIGVEGTPVFIAGSQIIPGAVNQEQLQQVLAQARKEAVN
jgi:protein-disulfide isomerase